MKCEIRYWKKEWEHPTISKGWDVKTVIRFLEMDPTWSKDITKIEIRCRR